MKKIFYLILLSLLMSCSTTEEIFDDITAPDYVSSSRAERLEIPPDLSQLEVSETYAVPGEIKSYKDFLNQDQLPAKNNQKNAIIQNPEGIRIIKSGNLRWLVVEKDPDSIWLYVKDFWEELGFRVLVANKRTGIIETEWMDTDDLKLDSNAGALSNFDKWLDSLSGFADKRKFRTRVEFGEGNITEIYISQRSAEAATDQHSRILETRQADYSPSTIYKIEKYQSDSEDNSEKIGISESRKIDDYEIDSELLTRLMIKLGASDFDAKNKITNPEILVKAEFINDKSQSLIKMFDPYDRSWRRLGLALDIIGFVTEDKNRSEGIYFVRYSEIDLPKTKKDDDQDSILDSLIFWGDDEEKVKVKEKDINEIDVYDDEKGYSGIEAPEVKPIDKDYIPDEFNQTESKVADEESWITNLWPTWGSQEEDKSLPDNEKRFRVRIKPNDDKTSSVFLDFPNGQKNHSQEARKVLQIIYEHLK